MKRFLLLVLSCFICLVACQKNKSEKKDGVAEKNYKILHIMSYHSSWKWTDDQLKGFQDALQKQNVTYKIFQMDTKRNNQPEWIKKMVLEAKYLINSWQPDLIFTSDDNAFLYIARDYINKEIPIVFSGVNASPEEYGFNGAANIAGVYEQEHFVPTVNLVRQIKLGIKKIVIITDSDNSWPDVIKRMKKTAAAELKDVEILDWIKIDTFDEYKKTIKYYQNRADAIGFLGVHTFKDRNGNNVPQIEVGKWTVENSKLPDFSFWKDRIPKGTLCSVTISGYEQGFRAGKIAHEILIDHKSPVDIGFVTTTKGEAAINVKRAQDLGLKINSNIVLSIENVNNYEWDQ